MCALRKPDRQRCVGRNTGAAPYRTVGKLVQSLMAGETGCLRGRQPTGAALYETGGLTISTPNVTVRAFPHEGAHIKGLVTVGADDVTLTGLVLDGRNNLDVASPVIIANRVRLLDNVITTRKTTRCVHVLGTSAAPLTGVRIEHNRIDGCDGEAVTLAQARSTVVADNLLYDTRGAGVRMHPNADSSSVVRIPMFMRWPGNPGVARGVTNRNLTANVDLAPTVMDTLAKTGDIPLAEPMDGRSLLGGGARSMLLTEGWPEIGRSAWAAVLTPPQLPGAYHIWSETQPADGDPAPPVREWEEWYDISATNQAENDNRYGAGGVPGGAGEPPVPVDLSPSGSLRKCRGSTQTIYPVPPCP